MHSAIADPDPVIYYEPKAIYRLFKEEVPEEIETLPLGQAQVVKSGKDISFISYGASLRAALEAAELLEADGVSVEVIDLLTISPLDTKTLIESVAKTGRAIVVHEGPRTCGVGAEVIARLDENVLLSLQAPIKRVTGYDVPVPYFSKEQWYLPDADKIVSAAQEILNF